MGCMQVCHALHPKYGGEPRAELGEVAAKLSRAKVVSYVCLRHCDCGLMVAK